MNWPEHSPLLSGMVFHPMMKIVAVILISIFGAPLVSYISGRILLPKMGLAVPGYWTWFWAELTVILFSSILSIFSRSLDN